MGINAVDESGNSSSGGASDNAQSGNGAGNAGDIERIVNEAISKALGPRLKRATSSIEEMVAARVQEAISKLPASAPAQDPDPPKKLNLESLDQKVDARLKALQDELAAERKQRAEAEAKVIDTRRRADLESHFARHMGADSPHLRAYLREYADQFQHRDGITYRVVKDEFGDESYIPADRAVEELFKSELKHLVPQRSAGLPPSSLARGVPMPGPAAQRGGFLEQEILHAQAMSDPATFNALYRDPSNKPK